VLIEERCIRRKYNAHSNVIWFKELDSLFALFALKIFHDQTMLFIAFSIFLYEENDYKPYTRG